MHSIREIEADDILKTSELGFMSAISLADVCVHSHAVLSKHLRKQEPMRAPAELHEPDDVGNCV